eukprot:3652195-Pleurochrysis_carterae.AAC.1
MNFRMRSLLAGDEANTVRRLKQVTDLQAAVSELNGIIERRLGTSPLPALPSMSFYTLLISEIDDIGKQNEKVIESQMPPCLSSRALTTCYSMAVASRVQCARVIVCRWDKLGSLSASLDEIELLVCDAAQRRHALTLSLPPGYPSMPPRAR